MHNAWNAFLISSHKHIRTHQSRMQALQHRQRSFGTDTAERERGPGTCNGASGLATCQSSSAEREGGAGTCNSALGSTERHCRRRGETWHMHTRGGGPGTCNGALGLAAKVDWHCGRRGGPGTCNPCLGVCGEDGLAHAVGERKPGTCNGASG